MEASVRTDAFGTAEPFGFVGGPRVMRVWWSGDVSGARRNVGTRGEMSQSAETRDSRGTDGCNRPRHTRCVSVQRERQNTHILLSYPQWSIRC